ncbi:MAG TPA: hypothetical protein VLC09_19245, partial [Polyangiaceae bacterium]|nr:hypothetical protein [Polyangiaceae bacterium]
MNDRPSDTHGAAARRSFSNIDEATVWDDPTYLRGEILTDALLQEHAGALARAHGKPTTQGSARPLRRRFLETRQLIQRAYASLAQGAERKRDPSPAELWLLDNSHVVEGQLREIEEDLPWGYLVELPRMSRGPMKGYPLVYGLCLDYLRHTDCHLDLGALARFVDAYQRERVLTIGELWAIPIMLRLGLVLAVGALAVSEARADDRDLAEQWALNLLGPSAVSPAPVTAARREALARLLRSHKQQPSDAFLVTLLKRLREREDAPAEAIDWIANQTARLQATPDELARRYHVRQAADQVSVGNAITSMRSINSVDWSEFFRATSHVEAVLARDPIGVYARQDDATRDRCRHAVERLARSARRSEMDVARTALGLAEYCAGAPEEYRAHVGYYLLDEGRGELQAALAHRPPFHRWFGELVERRPGLFYLGPLALGTVGLALLAWFGLSLVQVPLVVRVLVTPALLLAAS